MKALTNNEAVEATFKFFRGSRLGGQGENYYTIQIRQARIVSVRLVNPENTDPRVPNQPAYEEVAFVFQNIEWISNNGGVSHSDSVGGRF
jgi:type VI secretion system Hcp family effector